MATENLGITQVGASQQDKTTTMNDMVNSLELALTERASFAVPDPSNLVLTDTEFRETWLLEFTGTLTANRIVQLPTGIEKQFAVRNLTSGAFDLDVRVGGSGGTVTLIPNAFMLLHSDGTAGGVEVVEFPGAPGQTETINFQVNVFALNDIVTLVEYAFGDFDVLSFVGKLTGGTATLNFKINGTSITGLSAVALTTTQSSVTDATGANSAVVGDELRFDVDATSAGAGLTGSLQIRRT